MSDLTDVSAWICYLVIAVIGAGVSFVHISSKSGGISFWLHPPLWLVFCIYVAVPLALFWVLDATGELKDTSLILAILIGLIFRSVLGGTDSQFKAPSAVSGIWISLEKIIDSITAKLAEKEHKYKAWKRRKIQRIITELRDKKRIRELCKFAVRKGEVLPRNINQELSDLDKEISLSRKELIDLADQVYFETVKEHKTESIVAQIFNEEMVLSWFEANVSCKFYWPWVAKNGLILTAIVTAGYFAYEPIKSTSLHPELDYYSWRVGKTATSKKDLHRSMRSIVSVLTNKNNDDPYKQYLVDELLDELYGVDISADRAKIISQLLRESRANIPDRQLLRTKLSSILRSDRIEIRVIVQDVLTFLAGEYNWAAENDLLAVDMSKQLKNKEIENIISQWQAL